MGVLLISYELISVIALAVLFFLYLMKNADLAATIHLTCVAILAVVTVVLANTWAKKR